MAKRLITVWLTLTILLFSSVSIYAYADTDSVQADYFLKDFTVNGENIVNYKLSDPVVMRNGYIYVPMDETMGQVLGFTAALDDSGRTVYITPAASQKVDFGSRQVANNLDNLTMTVRSDLSATVVTQANPNGTQLDLTNCPVLMKGSVIYIPVNMMVNSGALGWSLYWNEYSGVTISTDSNVSAASIFDTAKANYNAGLVSYIMKKNPYVGAYNAQLMVEYFENYGEIYGVEKEILMAVAEGESTFYTNIKNSLGCYGMMQIKASTGAAYGFTKSQLLQPKYAIQMGSILLGREYSVFKGDSFKALSAYNRGEYAVKRGRYSRGYYNKVTKKYNKIKAHASSYQI